MCSSSCQLSCDLLVNIVLGRLYLGHVLGVSDQPQDLVTGKRQRHAHKQSLDWKHRQKMTYSGQNKMDGSWTTDHSFVTFAVITCGNIITTVTVGKDWTRTFGPRSPGSSSSTLNNSFIAPLRNCLLSLCIAPLFKHRKRTPTLNGSSCEPLDI